MNKYILALIFIGFIIMNETAPFLYNDAYTVRDIKWGWVIGFPIVLMIAFQFAKDKGKKEEHQE